MKAITVLRAFQRKAAGEDEKYNFVTEPFDPLHAEVICQCLKYDFTSVPRLKQQQVSQTCVYYW